MRVVAERRASPARRWLGAGGGLGFLPWAPGTWGSLGTALLAALVFGLEGPGEAWVGSGLIAQLGARDELLVLAGVLAFLALVLIVGVWVGNRAHTDWRTHDPGQFVLDEVVGQGLALLPLLPGPLDAPRLLLAFLAFRVFDVWKPTPCRQLERLPGGTGIMADDLMAGLYAMLIVSLSGQIGG